ncbi:hypothetical protein NDU88_003931 [Pleurodeles waltl]|uniref:Secreted protein n=1 Tax=Pleurodeles waltl TaxID=8319 RepID=A0AAV7UE80_PLEWA|nr:hypothetical protein NDU88_003931 [Pleurodeles waltl]
MCYTALAFQAPPPLWFTVLLGQGAPCYCRVALEAIGRPGGEAVAEQLEAGSCGRHLVGRDGRDTALETKREVGARKQERPTSRVR